MDGITGPSQLTHIHRQQKKEHTNKNDNFKKMLEGRLFLLAKKLIIIRLKLYFDVID